MQFIDSDPYRLFRYNRKIKKGAPIAETKMPAGRSFGMKMVLPIRSAQTSSVEPISIVPIAEVEKDAPFNTCLIMCGDIKPINPMPPANATAQPVSAALIASKMKRKYCTLTPMPSALSSPKSKA